MVNGTRVSADLVRGARTLWSGEAGYSGMEDLAEVIARIAVEPQLVRPRTAVRVQVERPVMQSRVLHDLPPVSKAALRPMVERQAHRYFRRNGKPLVVDACYLGGGKPARAVQLVAIEEPVITAIVAGVRAAGLTLERVAPAGLSPALSLLPPDERDRRRRERRLSLRRLGAAALGMWILVAGLSAASAVRQTKAAERELALLAEPVAALARVKRETARADAVAGQLAADAARRGELSVLLAGITAALPDSAFLTSLTVPERHRGYLGGYARRTSEVVARLERSGLVREPRIDGSLGREVIAGIEWERFNITFGEATE